MHAVSQTVRIFFFSQLKIMKKKKNKITTAIRDNTLNTACAETASQEPSCRAWTPHSPWCVQTRRESVSSEGNTSLEYLQNAGWCPRPVGHGDMTCLGSHTCLWLERDRQREDEKCVKGSTLRNMQHFNTVDSFLIAKHRTQILNGIQISDFQ